MTHQQEATKHARVVDAVDAFQVIDLNCSGRGAICRQEADEHDRAMNALEVALDDARSHARSKEQKLLVISKELKASKGLITDIAGQTLHLTSHLVMLV